MSPDRSGLIVLACGGRDYEDELHVFAALDAVHSARTVALLVHGACCEKDGKLRGADKHAERWAIRNEVPYIGVPAQWSQHDRAAGPIRNAQMLAQWHPDLVLALPGGRGTSDMVDRAKIARIRVVESAELLS